MLCSLQQKLAEEEAKKEEELKQQREELERYERKMAARKRKPRRQRTEEEIPTFFQRYGKFIIAPTLVVILALFIYYILLA